MKAALMAVASGAMHLLYGAAFAATCLAFYYGNPQLMVAFAPGCWIAHLWIGAFCPNSVFACHEPKQPRKPGVIYWD